MKRTATFSVIIAIMASLLSACVTSTGRPQEDPATALLNDDLKQLYQDVTTGTPEPNIVGTPIDATLNLRFCSESHILFEDTQIAVDAETKYYFVTWQFEPDVVEPVLGKSRVPCAVRGTILEVRRGETTPNMPHVIAALESVALQP